MIFLGLFSHIFGCIFIFIARSIEDEEKDTDNWIYQNTLQNASLGELYLTSIYFTM